MSIYKEKMKSRMKKKGVAILVLSSIAFLIAVLVFSQVIVKMTPGLKVDYLGEYQFEMFDYYGQGERILFYLDIAARRAAESVPMTQDMTDQDYIIKFKPVFKKYLDKFNVYAKETGKVNLTIDDYKFRIDGDKLILVTDKQLPVKLLNQQKKIESHVEYWISPSLTVTLEKKVKQTVTTKTPTKEPTTPTTKTKTQKVPTTSPTVLLRPQEELNFVMVSDIHVRDTNRWSLKWLRQSIDSIVNQKPELIIINGDMIDAKPKDKGSKVDKMWENFENDVRAKLSESKLAPSPGNHDMYNSYLRSSYTSYWKKHNSLEDIVNDGGNYPRYYSFDYKKNHFIILDGWKTYISKDNREWLKSDLEKAKDATNIFVFSHRPLKDICNKPYFCRNSELKPLSELITTFKDANIRFFASSHDHYFFKGSFRDINVIALGSPSYTYRVLKNKQKPSFVLVNVKNNQVKVQAYTYDGELLEESTVPPPYISLNDPHIS